MTGRSGPAKTQFEKKINYDIKQKGRGVCKIWNVLFIFFWNFIKYLLSIQEEFS